MTHDTTRDGELRLPFDPAERSGDAHIVFIGHIETPWRTRSDCPKNLRQARERARPGARLVVDAPWRQGLEGLEGATHLVAFYWMHEARRDLIVQAPRHRDAAAGVFALRSPVRPNPIALAVVAVRHLDMASGTIDIDAIDCINGTPLIDIKPWLPTVDVPPT